MEKLKKSIEAKLQLLNAQTSGAVEKQDYTSLERLRKTPSKKVEEVREVGYEEKGILTWSADLETKLGVLGKAIGGLKVSVYSLFRPGHV